MFLLPSSLDHFLHQTRIPHNPPPGIPIPISVSLEPGDALAGSWWLWAEAAGLMPSSALKAFGAGSLQVLPCLYSTWSSGHSWTWTTSSHGSPQRWAPCSISQAIWYPLPHLTSPSQPCPGTWWRRDMIWCAGLNHNLTLGDPAVWHGFYLWLWLWRLPGVIHLDWDTWP